MAEHLGKFQTRISNITFAVPLRLYILFLFLLLIGLVSLAFGVVASRSTQNLVDQTVAASFTGSSNLALQDLRRLEDTAIAAAEALAASPGADAANATNHDEQISILATVLLAVPGISSAYVGWPDGNFTLLRPLADLRDEMSAPESAQWLAQVIVGETPRFDFLDRNLTVLESRDSVIFAFDPRVRPWYIEATQTEDAVVTSPYVFYTTREPGITAARQAPSGAVVAVDISLWDLSTRLPDGQPVPSTQAAILDASGGVLAYSDMARLREAVSSQRTEGPAAPTDDLPSVGSIGSPIMESLATRWTGQAETVFETLTVDGGEWLSTIVPLDGRSTAFVMAVPMDSIASAPGTVRIQFLQVFGIAVLLAIPVIWLAARLLARPVETFAAEVEDVARLDFATSPRRVNHVKELARLDLSIRSMRSSLASYSEICRSIVESRESGAMLSEVLDALIAAADADRGAVWLARDTNSAPELIAVRNHHRAATGSATGKASGSGDTTLPDTIASTTESKVITTDADDASLGLLSGGAGQVSVLTIPLWTQAGRLIGALVIARPQVDSRQPAFPAPVLSLARFSARSAALSIERRGLVAELASTRQETELILNCIADGIHVLDISGRVRRQNPAAMAMLGWTENDIAEKGPQALIHYHHSGENPCSETDCPLFQTLRDGKTRHVDDDTFFRKDGTAFSVEYECTSLSDGRGEIIGAVVSFRDVTERRRSQRDLRERIKELQCLHRVLSLTSDQGRGARQICKDIVTILPESVLFDDKAAARIILDGEEHRSGQWPSPASTLHLASAPKASLRAAIRGDAGRDDAGELGFVEIAYFETQKDQGGSMGPFLPEERNMLEAVSAHIGQMLRNRQMAAKLTQSERLSAVGELTGGIAHDFNNLLTVILGNAELVAEALPKSSPLHPLAVMMQNAAGRGADLTYRLLAFARKQALAPKVVAVDGLILGMTVLLKRTLGEHIEIRTLVASDQLWRVMVDPAQLENTVLNLALNARDAMGSGGQLTIRLENVDLDETSPGWDEEMTPGSYVMIAVSDTGVGMTPDVAAHVFEPFFTTKDVGKGSGLGLSTVYGFTRQSGGYVRLYSELGHGTTVKIFLPRCIDSVQGSRAPDRPAVLTGGRERILLVEDDNLVRDHVAALLDGLGYSVHSVSNGVEALETVKQGRDFDLLFTDVVMPGGLNGRDLANEVRRLRPDLPVLFTSGYTDHAALRNGNAGGASGNGGTGSEGSGGGSESYANLLSKPYRRADLAAKIRETLAPADG